MPLVKAFLIVFFGVLFHISINRKNALCYNVADVTNDELGKLLADMFLSDPNRAKQGDITLNYQRHSNTPYKSDSSNEHLFKYVNPALISKPAYKTFDALFDNYFVYTGQREIQNFTENREIEEFLKFFYDGVVFRKMYEYLRSKKHPDAATLRIFQSKVRQLWFEFFSRKDGVLDTSSFEHVLIGEVTGGVSLRSQKPAEIGGLHNWYRFYQLEKTGALDYAGFVVKRKNSIALVQFDYLGVWKPTGSFMIGTSPQFDLGAYTLCFLLKPGFKKCTFDLDGCQVQITSHSLTQNRKTFIGTAFPSPGPASRTCR